MHTDAKAEFDPAAIDRIRRLGGDDLLRRVSVLFVDTGRTRLIELAQFVATSDLTGMARTAHSMRGSAGNLGALELMRVATEVELAATEARTADLPVLVARLQAAMESATTHFGPPGPDSP